MDNGWDESAAAWIADMGEAGDFSREHVLDAPMRARVRAAAPRRAVDIGCGEGRFTRWMRAQGIAATGVEPSEPMRAAAMQRDPGGAYRGDRAEALSLDDGSVDLAVFYLTLIDIEAPGVAIAEAARVLAPGGRVLIANLQPFHTAARSYEKLADGARMLIVDNYLEERDAWYEWRGIRIRNWHRPLSVYLSALLGAGLTLTHFDEPPATGGSRRERERYNKAPFFYLMEWRKPG